MSRSTAAPGSGRLGPAANPASTRHASPEPARQMAHDCEHPPQDGRHVDHRRPRLDPRTDPARPALLGPVERPSRDAGIAAKRGGTYLCMEGPQFSTKAESNLYRSWGMDVIGMTNLQEAKLAREAEICYAT